MQAFLNRWMPIDVSAHGAPLDRLNTWVHWLMLILFVGWGIYFVYVLIRFRAGATKPSNGVFFLLAIVGMVQLGFVALFVSVRRRGKELQERKDSFEVINGGLR